MNVIRGFKRLVKNLIFLSTHDLSRGEAGTEFIYRIIRHAEELEKAKMVFHEDDSFCIYNDDDSWDTLLASPKSFVRIGDGELSLISGKAIDFQTYDKKLANELIQILSSDRTDLYVGIDYQYFHGFENVTEQIRKHNYLWGVEYKKILVRYCNPNRKYLSSSFNQLYVDYIDYDWDRYLRNITKLFQSKDIVVFAGKGIFDGFKYNLFDLAHSCEYVWSLPKNAYNEFDILLDRARFFPKDKVLCFVLGPTSKPLVSELSKDGYVAWDLGHMPKDYDCCCRKAAKTNKDVIRYFAPD